MKFDLKEAYVNFVFVWAVALLISVMIGMIYFLSYFLGTLIKTAPLYLTIPCVVLIVSIVFAICGGLK